MAEMSGITPVSADNNTQYVKLPASLFFNAAKNAVTDGVFPGYQTYVNIYTGQLWAADNRRIVGSNTTPMLNGPMVRLYHTGATLKIYQTVPTIVGNTSKVLIGVNLIKEWNLSRADFDDAGWGNLTGNFKVYNSLVGIWTKTVKTPDTIVNGVVKRGTDIVTVDLDKTLQEIFLLYLSSAYANIPQLRIFRYKHMSDQTQAYLKQALLKAIQFGLTNRNILQKVNDVSVKGSQIDVTVTTKEILTQLSWWGDRARDDLLISGIFDYDLVNDQKYITSLTRNGNYIIHSKGFVDDYIEYSSETEEV